MAVWFPDNNSNPFLLDFKKFWYVSFGSRSFMDWISVRPPVHPSCILIDSNGVCGGYIQNIGILDNSSC